MCRSKKETENDVAASKKLPHIFFGELQIALSIQHIIFLF
jgi:hypothetical protein